MIILVAAIQEIQRNIDVAVFHDRSRAQRTWGHFSLDCSVLDVTSCGAAVGAVTRFVLAAALVSAWT